MSDIDGNFAANFTPLHLRSLLASKQMLQEALAVFYGQNKFSFTVDHPQRVNNITKSLAERFPPGFEFQRLSHLTIHVRNVGGWAHDGMDWNALGSMACLKTLRCCFYTTPGTLLVSDRSPWVLGTMCSIICATKSQAELSWESTTPEDSQPADDLAIPIHGNLSMVARLATLQGSASGQTKATAIVIDDKDHA